MAMTGSHMLAQVQKLYHGRRTGDLSAFAEVLAPDATFHFMGNESVVRAFPAGDTDGATDPNAVAQALWNVFVRKHGEGAVPVDRSGRAGSHAGCPLSSLAPANRREASHASRPRPRAAAASCA